MSTELICIVCPNGCHLNVEKSDQGLVVKGSRCVRGETYAINELTHPTRVVTGVIATSSARFPFAPVKTSGPIPREMISQVLASMRTLQVTLPVRRGEVVADGSWGPGVQVVFTRTLPPPGKGGEL